jgi:hypothetical protein
MILRTYRGFDIDLLRDANPHLSIQMRAGGEKVLIKTKPTPLATMGRCVICKKRTTHRNIHGTFNCDGPDCIPY